MATHDAQKILIKLHADAPPTFRLADAIPVFHQWIQAQALPDVMIDVADYTHVQDGPGVVLVCHEAHYGLEQVGGRLGLRYVHMRGPAMPSLAARLAASLRDALTACERLEQSQGLSGGVRFTLDGMCVGINDGLYAGDAAMAEALRNEVTELARAVLDDPRAEVVTTSVGKTLPQVQVRSSAKAAVGAARARALSRAP